MDNRELLENLSKQLGILLNKQKQMTSEMLSIQHQLQALKAKESSPTINAELKEPTLLTTQAPTLADHQGEAPTANIDHQPQNARADKSSSAFGVSQELEDFIGTNVISKIGIVITIIGVFIGAKYAIDKELVSPLMRIILSYAFAVALFVIALRLKPKYENFSSILMGGGLAVTYFITYIAFSFYQLFPQGVAFAMMIVTTVAAVLAALWYQQKVIALIGQVAAYAIPFLLGDGKGNVAILFTYVSIINIGLLVLSFKKDWKILYRIAFFITWLIYASWVISSGNVADKFSKGLIFIAINFFTFYVKFLSYKIVKKQMYQAGEIAILLVNALLFFFLGSYLIQENYDSHVVLTWFTLCNAAIHFVAGYFIYQLRLADKSVYQFIVGLGLLFVTVSIPIEFDGSWVTLLWTIEATILFYISQANDRKLYADISRPLVVIAIVSLLQDWTVAYPYIKGVEFNVLSPRPFLNVNFWLSIFVCSCFGYIGYKAGRNMDRERVLTSFFSKVLPVIFVLLLYFTFYNEVHLTWDVAMLQTSTTVSHSYHHLQTISLLIFSCLYVAALILINYRVIKMQGINSLLLAGAIMVNVIMIFRGLYVLGELRDNYLQQQLISSATKWLILVRYCCFMALAMLWISAWRTTKVSQAPSFQVFFSFLFNFTCLSIICNEFIHWMDLAGYTNQYKLGLSIIWGVYALVLIFTGIIRRKKHLRIGAMLLFGLTLLKLFFYDLSSLSTISKTIVLLMLGVLLLIASFLYNKYKDLIFLKEE